MANNIYGLKKAAGTIAVDKGISGRNRGSNAASYPIGRMIVDPKDRPELKEVANKHLFPGVLKANQESLKKHGYEVSGNYFGEGSYGLAYNLTDGKVLKVTQDQTEAKTSYSIKNKNLKYVVKIFDVFKLKNPDSESTKQFFGIVQEKLEDPGDDDRYDFSDILIDLSNDLGGRNVRQYARNRNWLEFLKEITKIRQEVVAEEEVALGQKVDKKLKIELFLKLALKLKKFNFDLMLNELKAHNIQFSDFHAGNIMKRGDKFVLIDLGSNSMVAGAQEPPMIESIEIKPEDFGYNADGYRLQDRYVFQGLPIAVENKAGSYRSWGKLPHEKTLMIFDYGYIEGVEGSDKDEVDVYIGQNQEAQFVYVIHQTKKENNFEGFDEDKCMIGFDSEEEAKLAYLAHYDDVRFYGGMSAMPLDKFKEKLLLLTISKSKKLTNEIYKIITEDLWGNKTSSTNVDNPKSAKSVLKKFSKSLKNKKNISTGLAKVLGSGTQGTAFDIGGGKVLKITKDRKEALASNKIKGKTLKYVVKVFDVYRFKDTDLYGIELEKLEELSNDEKIRLNKIIDVTEIRSFLQEANYNWDKAIEMMYDYYINKYGGKDGYKSEKAKKIIEDLDRVVDELEKFNMKNITEELIANGIKFLDFTGENLMKRNGVCIINDLGYSKVTGGQEPEVFETVNEDLKTAGKENIIKTLDMNAQRLKDIKRINVSSKKELGSGQKGVAFDIGGNKVLKVTTDESEAKASNLMKGKTPPHIVTVFDVFQFQKIATEEPLYGIVTEKLTKLSEQEKREVDGSLNYIRDHEHLLNALATKTWQEFEGALNQQVEKDVAEEIDISKDSPNYESKLKKISVKKYDFIMNILKKYSIQEMSEELRRNGIKFADYHGDNLMKRGSEYVINDLGASKSNGPNPELFEDIVERAIEEILVKLKIENPLSSFASTGLISQSGTWSRPSLIDPKDKEEVDELQSTKK